VQAHAHLAGPRRGQLELVDVQGAAHALEDGRTYAHQPASPSQATRRIASRATSNRVASVTPIGGQGAIQPARRSIRRP
jgi:hypothetical protein